MKFIAVDHSLFKHLVFIYFIFGEVFVSFFVYLFLGSFNSQHRFWFIFSYVFFPFGMKKNCQGFSLDESLGMSHFSLTNDGVHNIPYIIYPYVLTVSITVYTVYTWTTSRTKMFKRGRNCSRNRFNARGKVGENKQLLAPSQLVHSVATWKGSSIWSEDYS